MVAIFPNDAAIVRLVGTLQAKQTDQWQVTQPYITEGSLARVVYPDNPRALVEDEKAS